MSAASARYSDIYTMGQWIRHPVFTVMLGAVAAILVAGCLNTSNIRSPRGSADADAHNFEPVHDIPIPAGSTLDNDRSLILSTETQWTGRVVLNASSNMAKIFAYYAKQMRKLGWQPITSIMGENSVQTFIQGDRTATVQIDPGTLIGSTITVTMAPRQPSQITGIDRPVQDTSLQADRLPQRPGRSAPHRPQQAGAPR